ncbi:MAG TPA: adenylate/guanylate cyclase domain-containing protein [candidate division WOR-3 bacterium]|uniref:Adenylate/guanylate cyclase domain-containing protein n=1 Tax=candidate division WOR-3 bacterium TaxID=2052148 RepID=A0A9C9ELC1_UNCW3|nr:adenylate/guanylate cyclase domain-containing protein [candidate division WOR-3 bacterium]
MKNKIITVFAIAAASVFLVNLLCLFKPFWLPFERRVYDIKYRLNISHEKCEEIVVVAIDEKSLLKLGRYQNWQRLYFAKVIDYLNNARVIGLDILFAEPDTLSLELRRYFTKPSYDSLLEAAIKENGRVVLVSSFEKPPIYTRFNRIGLGKVFADDDGVIRRGFSELFGKQTFAAEVAAFLNKRPLQNDFLIYFLDRSSFRRISFSDVYFRRVPQEFFNDKIILIGGTASGLFDYHAVPFTRKLAGVLVQANLINNFINNLKIDEIPYSFAIILILILSIIFAFLILYRHTHIYLITIIVIYLIFIILSFFLFSLRIELGIIRPTYILVCTVVIALIHRYRFEEKEKKKIKQIFSRYYSRELVEKVTAAPPKLGGEKVDCTILFADIRNFTPYAEKTAPEDVGMKLNRFLDEMVKSTFEYQGRVDKFIGDCIMAVFGSPVRVRNHAVNACYAALDMVAKAEKLGFRIGVGINSGEVISGNFGSPMRMEYTVIGDAVNLASRLEGVTKKFDCSIVVGAATYKMVMADPVPELEFRELGEVKVKGKEETIKVYSLSRRGAH